MIVGCTGCHNQRVTNGLELSKAEKQEPYIEYYYRKSAGIPSHVIRSIQNSPYPEENALPFEKLNDLLKPGYSFLENGYCKMSDGSVYVAVLTEMPKVTGKMLDWWFWWHAMDPLRYRIWYPEAHFSTTLNVDRDEYANRKGPYNERYWNTTNYPVEDIGIVKETLSIKFISPSDFGFDMSRFEEANVATVICAVVGSVDRKLSQHTYICHFVRRTETGVEMRSRFWIGHTILRDGSSEKSVINKLINNRVIKRLLLPKKVGFAMAMHCTREYNRLAGILPELYNTYK